MIRRSAAAIAIIFSVLVVAVACGEPPPTQPTSSATETSPPLQPTPTEPQPTPANSAMATGTVAYREKIALGPNAVVAIQLMDVSRADAPGIVLGEQNIENPGQVPISFEIEYAPAQVDERFTYAIRARITEDDKLAFINDTAYQVITRGNPTHVDMVLVKVGEAPVVFALDVCAATLAAQLPIEFEFTGTVPTGFDGINKANCTFTKPVQTVTVVLTGPATHTETFTLAEPATQVSFPLPEGTLSVSTLEIVPPGEYQREMTATSADGETLTISDQTGFLKTVTILEPSN